ncbi:MAG TPA: hypothetical protein VLJ39_03215, partial [Tepidisphaeraceae bacterium]|nr:hypothetical protein [Tepidisphaeraceae bacterium]
ELKNNNNALLKFMRGGGWRSGPATLAGGTGYDDNGWLPAATHGWYSTLQEFGHLKKNFVYDYGSAQGYEVNIQLRPGETLTRNWSNKGLHVNMFEGGKPECLNGVVGQGQLRYSPGFGDLAPGRIGNGTDEWNVPLGEDKLKHVALEFENLASAPGGGIRVKDAPKPGVFVLRMPSSYVYLGGSITLKPAVGPGGSVQVIFSDNNGLAWKSLGTISDSAEHKIDLQPLTFRKYDYRLKFVLAGQGTGLDALTILNDIQYSQRALPALVQGDNVIHFNAGPQEGTIAVEGLTEKPDKPKNLLFADFNPKLTNVSDEHLQVKGATGEVLIPIETPGDLTRLRIGCHYRARGPKDGWAIEASFDQGKTFVPVGALEGGHAGFTKYLVFDHVPARTRSALVRFAGTQRNTTLILDLRISADYAEPHGGFAPVRVTYRWDESGKPHEDTRVIQSADATYTLHCDEKPTMRSISIQLAQ